LAIRHLSFNHGQIIRVARQRRERFQMFFRREELRRIKAA
jgi:hypothetical protein